MRKAFLIVFLFLICSMLLPVSSYSCGDKFLVIGRGLRYERAHAAAHPGSILIYADSGATKELQSYLKLAGHKVETAGDENKLWSSLKSARYDVVLVNMNDIGMLEAKIISTPSKPTVVPVIYTSKGADLTAAQKQYSCVLKNDKKNRDSVAVIDAVMASRAKGKPVMCEWSK